MKKRNYILSIVLLIAAIVFTILVAKIDVKPIGPINPETGIQSEVGFSTINSVIAKKLQFNSTFYKISKYVGYLAFGFVAFYALIGLIELIKKKNLKEINKVIWALAIFYICVAIVYALFEVLTINYRPLVMKNELEASYPSSHTMLAICVCGSSLLASYSIVKNKKIRIILNIAAWGIMLVVVVSRLLSGVHWFTDIIGGILISSFMIQTFGNVVRKIQKTQEADN